LAKLTDPAIVEAVLNLVLNHAALERSRPFVLGICGSQGSGKSTLSAILQEDLTARGLPTVVLSLDDIYKTRAERDSMARLHHPLFRTRGVPGTHDVSLALDILCALENGQPAPLPRFDKAADNRADPSLWGMAPADTRVLIFEGWFVGVRPAAEVPDPAPLNALEAAEDPQGTWRQLAEQALRDDYQSLFARLDALVLLAAPDFDVVLSWRIQQEHALRANGRGGMTDEEVGVFIQHYERLTRRILTEMPEYADLVIDLDQFRVARAIRHRKSFNRD
jgi:D-glycerate 3-kinase